jgi:hypothetical protein
VRGKAGARKSKEQEKQKTGKSEKENALVLRFPFLLFPALAFPAFSLPAYRLPGDFRYVLSPASAD